MDPVAALVVILALIALATAVGLVWRATNGRARRGSDRAVTPEHLGLATASAFGRHATLVQFSTEFCARCPATRTLLGTIADERDGVVHLDVDLTHRPDIASRFDVRQTPTTLILDSAGRLRARIGGAPRRVEVVTALDHLVPPLTATPSPKETLR